MTRQIARTPKPTGDAEAPEHIQLAWHIEEQITSKAGTLTIDDSDLDEGDSDEEVIEISDNASSEDETTKTASAAKTIAVAKAYRSTNPISQPAGKRSRPATEALSSITSIFNPSSMKQRDDDRFAQSMQLTQLTHLQIELHETRTRVDQLRDQLSMETRRADRAEAQLDMLRTLGGSGSFVGHGERYRNEGRAGGYRNSHHHHGLYGRTLLPEMDTIVETQPIHQRDNFTPFDSPANTRSVAPEFAVGHSSSPLMATATSRMPASHFNVTISPRKSFTTEGPSEENSRLTEVTDGTSVTSEQRNM